MKQISINGIGGVPTEVYEFGKGSGPSIVITGAIHGNEQTGVHAANLLMKKLEGANILGKVKVIPVCNKTAFMVRERTSPYDKIDLSRIFPGDVNGSYTHRTAAMLWEETKDAEYIVDLHCCGITGAIYTLSIYDEMPYQVELAKALGMPNVCQSGGTSGQFFTETARQRGQKALLIELPGGQPGGVIDIPSAEFCAEGLYNYMVYLGIIEGTYTPYNDIVFCGKLKSITASSEGFFEAKVASGARVIEGQVIGVLDGKEITADADSVLTSVSLPRYAFTGDTLFRIMPIRHNI